MGILVAISQRSSTHRSRGYAKLRHCRLEKSETNYHVKTVYFILNSWFFLLQRNAADLERKRIAELKAEGRYVGPDKPMDHEKAFFPKYDEYEVLPGEDKDQTDRWKDYKNPYLDKDEEFVTKKK